MKIGFTTYLALGKLERFNKENKFLYNVREVIRKAYLLKQKGKYPLKNPKKIFPAHNRYKWKYDPFKPIRITAILDPEDYVVIQDILVERTGKIWAFDKLIKVLLKEFINTDGIILEQKDFTNLKKFEKRFKKYYGNILKNWSK